MRKKDILSLFISNSGITAATRMYKKKFNKCLPILAYHRIMDFDEQNYPADIELISANPTSFEKQVKYLKKHYQPLKFSELSYYISNPRKLIKPPVIITFDDGFLDNYKFAYPILERHKVPATFFITTDAIENGTPFWFDLIAYLILRHNNDYIIISDKKVTIGHTLESKRNAINKLLLHLKVIPEAEKNKIIAEVKTQIPFENDYLKMTRNMSWDELNVMKNNGMEIGSHSVTHPILSRMSNDEIKKEIGDSKRMIEEKLETECIVFSYPVGGYEEYNSYSLDQLKLSNYKYACTYEPGINDLSNEDFYQFKRIHIERYTAFHNFKNSLLIPFIS